MVDEQEKNSNKLEMRIDKFDKDQKMNSIETL